MKKINIKITKENIILILILLLSSVLNLANLTIEGYANQYYAAGVRSMTLNLKNFFFVSFDPAGFVSIDKPPLGFWIQAISAKIFGYSGWSIILPQAIAGVISVWLIYKIVKKSFGTIAGLISAFCLAVTPVFVAVSRNNTIDNLLVMTLLLACLALSAAVEKGKTRYLLVCMALIGIGFNIKMLQAYMVGPAVYITYLLCAGTTIKKRIINLVIGSVLLLTVSLSWAFVVDLVPASARPYVDSSTNNTVMELIIGHNGLERLGFSSSSSGKGGNVPESSQNDKNQGTPPSSKKQKEYSINRFNGKTPAPPKGKMQMPGKGGRRGAAGNSTFGGSENPSIIRLFSNNSLSDQIIWLLPVALIGSIAAFIKERKLSTIKDKKKCALLLWLMWLVPVFIYFSYTTGTFHPYYLTMLAPPISALAGIGLVSMWSLYKDGSWKALFLPMSLIANSALQLLLLSYNSSYLIAKILFILISLSGIICSVLLIIFKLRPIVLKEKKLYMLILSIFINLSICPLVWSATTVFYESNGSFPSAGPSLIGSHRAGSVPANRSIAENSSTEKLVKYLKAHKTKEKYLLAVTSTNTYASEIIIKTGEPVMALGGFLGSDNILTLNEFKQLVQKGQLRYAIVGGQGGETNSTISNWIVKNGAKVNSSAWNDSIPVNASSKQNNRNNLKNSKLKAGIGFGNQQSLQLYDLKSK
ncbi:glycosyltransferase family 39 protein [Clostridium oryzae]|uniref:Undecaprenyl phosphate-alpha-4-amino-4-deoxy-L-arabinose arabinosyl transferase n=1 Tax=Clostridium oryzae TaxID=1450648 RepID=A0A1V4IDI3_9CLOT|nr:glycosyltransferase family 39 protein [Clostridium oryzae]OPJ57979.1 undecaprenyl phosphate-alpha-4-amino-4-deoxy-L-arabinose arabinosyl transferase [Clostridium oryzae]